MEPTDQYKPTAESCCCSGSCQAPATENSILNPQAEGNLQTTLRVAGMDCGEEVAAVERALKPLPDVRDALRPVPKSVMQEIKRTFTNASIEVRRATACAIGVGEPELHRWVFGTSKPSIANAQLIKVWWDHGGFSFRTGNLSELPARAGSGNVIEQLRALLADAPKGALRVAAADSGIDANSLGTYVSGARRATSETLREIGVWLATVDVNSYRGFSQAEWKSFRAKFGKLSRPEKRHLARKLGVSDNSLDGWYRGTANPKLVAIRAIKAWLQEGSPRASSRSSRRTRDG